MELTQKGEVVSRLQAKAGQIGKILNNLEKYNHLIKDSNRDRKSFEKRPTSFDKKFTTTSKTESKDSKSSEAANCGSGNSEITNTNANESHVTKESENVAAFETKEFVIVKQEGNEVTEIEN